jgi:hypothetical protein
MTTVLSGRRFQNPDGFPLISALLIYTFAVTVCLSIRSVQAEERWLVLLALSGAGVLFYVWRNIEWHGHQFDSFCAILLLASIANRLLYSLDLLISGMRTDAWPVVSFDPGTAMCKGEVITVVGILLTAWTWHAFNQRARPADRFASIALQHSHSPRGYWLLYVFGVAIEGATRLYGEEVAALGALASVARAGGLMAILALTYYVWEKRVVRLAMVILLSVPFLYASLGSGFKENVIFAGLPVAIVAWREMRSRQERIALILVGALLVGIVTSYIQYFRERVWTRGESMSIMDVTRDYMEHERYQDDATAGMPLFLARNNAMYHHGWSTDLGDNEEVRAAEVFAPLVYIFIPRFLWPEKPDINPGADHSERIWGSHYVLVTNSATAAGLYPAAYMATGYAGVIGIAIATGALMAFLYYLISRYASGFSTGIYAWLLFLTALRLDENWPVYVLSAPIINAVYAVALGAMAAVFSGAGVSVRAKP